MSGATVNNDVPLSSRLLHVCSAIDCQQQLKLTDHLYHTTFRRSISPPTTKPGPAAATTTFAFHHDSP
jgi:hypothetical protein